MAKREHKEQDLMGSNWYARGMKCEPPRGSNGLVDTTPLTKVEVVPSKPKTDKKPAVPGVNALEASDEQFLAWVIKRLGGVTISTRIPFRLMCLAALDSDSSEAELD